MPKILCGKCQKTMKASKIGVTVAEMFLTPPRPYKLWLADIVTCPECGCQVISNFGDHPIAEHWQDNFAAILAGIESVIEWYE